MPLEEDGVTYIPPQVAKRAEFLSHHSCWKNSTVTFIISTASLRNLIVNQNNKCIAAIQLGLLQKKKFLSFDISGGFKIIFHEECKLLVNRLCLSSSCAPRKITLSAAMQKAAALVCSFLEDLVAH